MTEPRRPVAVVSGGAAGIGKAIARRICAAGSPVVLNDVRGEELMATTAVLEAAGGVVVPVVGDVAEPGVCERIADTAIRSFGTIDHVVNNAAVARPGPAASMPLDDWEHVIRVNLTAGFLLVKACAAPMLERARQRRSEARSNGKIVNIASVDGLFGVEGQVNYGSAKAGLIGMTMSLAREWGRYRINVNAVAPGGTITEMSRPLLEDPRASSRLLTLVPLRRWAEPDEIAGAVMFLLGPDSDYLTGQTISVCGGMRIAP